MTYDSDEYLEFIKARRAQIESLVADAAEKSLKQYLLKLFLRLTRQAIGFLARIAHKS